MLRRLVFVTLVLVAGCRAAVVAPPHHALHPPPLAKIARVSPPPSLGPGPAVVQRESVLHLDEADGPEIGRAFAGAHVHVARVEGTAAEIALPQFQRPFRVEGGVTEKPLTAWIDASALGTRAIPLVEPPLAGRAARDQYMRVADRPGELGFFYMRCGPFEILEQGPETTRVAQRADGVELVGWSEERVLGTRGDFRCQPHVVEDGAAPPGYEQARSVDVAAVLRAGRTIHWLVETDDGHYACEDWHVTRSELRHVRRNMQTEYTLEREGDRVVLLGPTMRSPQGESAFGCGDDYRAVDLDADRLVLVPHAGSRPIAAYDPDDTEVWYLTESACRAAAARASSPPALATAELPPVHSGC